MSKIMECERLRSERSGYKTLVKKVLGEVTGKSELCRYQTPGAYLNVIKARNRIRELNSELMEGVPKDELECAVLEIEEFDRLCEETLERLFEVLPGDHAYKSVQFPPHVQVRNNEAVVECINEPILGPFDGKDKRFWFVWKTSFERRVHNNAGLDNSLKFRHLIASLVRNSPAYRKVIIFGAAEFPYDLAWSRLKEEYDDVKGMRACHIRALRELPSRFSVRSATQVYDLERLHEKAVECIYALRGLNVADGDFSQLAFLGVKDCLPYDLRVSFNLSHPGPAESAEDQLESVLVFLKAHISASKEALHGSKDQRQRKQNIKDVHYANNGDEQLN